jgi:hypothetical protein
MPRILQAMFVFSRPPHTQPPSIRMRHHDGPIFFFWFFIFGGRPPPHELGPDKRRTGLRQSRDSPPSPPGHTTGHIRTGRASTTKRKRRLPVGHAGRERTEDSVFRPLRLVRPLISSLWRALPPSPQNKARAVAHPPPPLPPHPSPRSFISRQSRRRRTGMAGGEGGFRLLLACRSLCVPSSSFLPAAGAPRMTARCAKPPPPPDLVRLGPSFVRQGQVVSSSLKTSVLPPPIPPCAALPPYRRG